MTAPLSEQKALVTNPKAMEQINFTKILNRSEVTVIFFTCEIEKETTLDFAQGTVRILYIYFSLI